MRRGAWIVERPLALFMAWQLEGKKPKKKPRELGDFRKGRLCECGVISC